MADNNDDVTALENFIKSTIVDFVNTAISCEVVSYDRGRVTVKPIGDKGYDDGDANSYPTIHNLRMQWPQFDGGRAGIKGPVKPGDRGLMIVCQHANDDSGDNRKYSLVDSYFIPGGGYSDSVAGNDDLRVYYGDSFFSLTAGGKVTLNAPGGFEVKAPSSTFSGTATFTGDAVAAGISVSKHTHRGDSGGTTGGPQ